MLSVAELQKLAQQMYAVPKAGLTQMLSAWARIDPGNELRQLLQNTGLTIDQFAHALEPIRNANNPEDQGLLRECFLANFGRELMAWHLLQSLAQHPQHHLYRTFQQAGLSWETLLQNVRELSDGPSKDPSKILASVFSDLHLGSQKREEILSRYGRELTVLAKQKNFDDLEDRPVEIDHLMTILARKYKGNCIITGPAGVGKTALVELLARRITQDQCDVFLKNTKIWEIAMSKVLAGTRYRGDFEERLHEILQRLSAIKPAILFLDEFHLIWGAGRAEGVVMDASNILKPFLVRKEIPVIGATTTEEYYKYIAQDQALARRFDELCLQEPSPELVQRMVQRQAQSLSQYHQIKIETLAIDQAIALTNRHVPHRWQPDKAVDLLDNACVLAKRNQHSDLEPYDLLETLSRQTGRSIGQLTGEDCQLLQNLAKNMKNKIIGQDHAIEKVVSTLIYRFQELGTPERPLGTFLFVGDTGVGKTELARVLTKSYFHSLHNLLHIDLAEYSQPGSLHRLIGTPVGFIDSDQPGILISWLHQHSTGVILFDEIEKAHLEVQQLLLGLLDNGRVQSSRGEKMEVRPYVIILTTNAVTHRQLQRSKPGFGVAKSEIPAMELLNDHFPREFLGRMDEIILFYSLGKEELIRILDLRLQEALERLEHRKIHVTFDHDNMLTYLSNELEQNQTGARGIVRLLETQLLQPIAEVILGSHPPLQVEIEPDFYKHKPNAIRVGK